MAGTDYQLVEYWVGAWHAYFYLCLFGYFIQLRGSSNKGISGPSEPRADAIIWWNPTLDDAGGLIAPCELISSHINSAQVLNNLFSARAG